MFSSDLRLIQVVRRTSNLDCGIFGNISDDLGKSVTNAHSPMVNMAYGYARRTAAAALYLQGVFTYEQYLYVCGIFLGLQHSTGHSVEFQEEAYSQAVELMQSYDARLTRDILQWIVYHVHSSNGGLGNQLEIMTYEELLLYAYLSMKCVNCTQEQINQAYYTDLNSQLNQNNQSDYNNQTSQTSDYPIASISTWIGFYLGMFFLFLVAVAIGEYGKSPIVVLLVLILMQLITINIACQKPQVNKNPSLIYYCRGYWLLVAVASVFGMLCYLISGRFFGMLCYLISGR